MFFKRTDNLTSNLTSYDFVKAISVLFMFVDHIGAFFIPDEMWLRVFGRLGFVAWFFLAGYSKSGDVSPKLWIGALILIATNIITGSYIFSLNALVSFILIRVLMTHRYSLYFSNYEILLTVSVVFIVLSIPTNYLFEYGTLTFLLAMFGYAVRNKEILGVHRYAVIAFCAVVAGVAGMVQNMTFGFGMIESIVCSILIGIMCLALYHFRRLEFPDLTEKLPKSITRLIQFGGRYTLEIYVIHLVVIKFYLLMTDTTGRYELFQPSFFS